MRRAFLLLLLAGCATASAPAPEFRLSTFSADITPPLGHALCGGMVAPASKIADPLSALGIVLSGPDEPLVIVALDWTELRNDAYERWRSALATAAGTTPSRILLSCVHQHDAPYADLGAQRLLDAQGMKGFHVDPDFHERAVQAVAAALRASLKSSRPVTHVGTGEAKIARVASNRRVVGPDGKAKFNRYSKTADPAIRNAPEGLIDPMLKTLSFWDEHQPLAAISSYAVHPMSYYGRGAVSADFPGLARRQRQDETPDMLQIYVSGCAGDVTAAKYNMADDASRQALAERLHDGMVRAWLATKRVPMKKMVLRTAPVAFKLPEAGPYSEATMKTTLADATAKKGDRLNAALGLSWSSRMDHPLEVSAVDFGPAQYLLMPAESFVEFQLSAQYLRLDQMIVTAGYGECAPGYIPTEAARGEGYVEEHGYCWVAAGAEAALRAAMSIALRH